MVSDSEVVSCESRRLTDALGFGDDTMITRAVFETGLLETLVRLVV